MTAELHAPTGAAHPDVRGFEPGDIPALGPLMYRAYLNTIDYDGESLEQSAAEIAKTVDGEYGEFMPSCSKVATREGHLVSATLITRFEDRPFVAFTFTDPALSGGGLARSCMQAAMAELFRQGERELRLVVTLANAPAVALYTGLGFRI
jgi:GNAT superfamily N-acetyltransferase